MSIHFLDSCLTLSSQNKALIVASCVSLVATVGLLSAIAVRSKFDDTLLFHLTSSDVLSKMSAFNTRAVKSPGMFVRTHVAFYFVSLLLSDILQGEFFCLYAQPRDIYDLDVHAWSRTGERGPIRCGGADYVRRMLTSHILSQQLALSSTRHG